MAKTFRPEIPPHVAEMISGFHPDLKRSVKAAFRAIATDPECGEPLRRDLEELWKYRVRRFGIVYTIESKTRKIRVMAVGHRQRVYEELAEQIKENVKSKGK